MTFVRSIVPGKTQAESSITLGGAHQTHVTGPGKKGVRAAFYQEPLLAMKIDSWVPGKMLHCGLWGKGDTACSHHWVGHWLT